MPYNYSYPLKFKLKMLRQKNEAKLTETERMKKMEKMSHIKKNFEDHDFS